LKRLLSKIKTTITHTHTHTQPAVSVWNYPPTFLRDVGAYKKEEEGKISDEMVAMAFIEIILYLPCVTFSL
jgi:hypothetical protein